MKEYCAQNERLVLHLNFTKDNIVATEYRRLYLSDGIYSIRRMWRREVNPRSPSSARISKMQIASAVRAITGQAHNRLIQIVLNHKIDHGIAQPYGAGDLLSKEVSKSNPNRARPS